MTSSEIRAMLDAHVPIFLGGVSGSGMIGLARMCLQMGLTVRGCDRKRTEAVRDLETAGLVFLPEDRVASEGLGDNTGLVVCSAALPNTHQVRVVAASTKIPVVRRADMVAALLKDREVIVVAGTHGKTTTAVLTAHLLRKLGRDVSFYIGAEVPLFGTSARLGTDVLAVVEADESDGSFSAFDPAHVLLLNIEEDHLDHYANLSEIENAFVAVLERCRGVRVVCGDDPGARRAADRMGATVIYGFGADVEVRGVDCASTGAGSCLQVVFPGGAQAQFEIALPGRHNALNALGVVTLCRALGFDLNQAVGAFADVRGARRRYEVVAQNRFGTVIDDYAHHPTEVQATLDAARARIRGRLVAIFQPHRFSRTEALMERFASCFGSADKVLLTGVYGAGEVTQQNNAAMRLCEAVRSHSVDVELHETLSGLCHAVRAGWKEGDGALFMGAGDIDSVAVSIGNEVGWVGELADRLGSTASVRLYEPMSKHTTLRVGGPVDAWVEISNEDSLRTLFDFAKQESLPVRIIGRGTNLLVRDGGIRGICCHLAGGSFNQIVIEGARVVAGAGVRLKELVAATKKSGLGGFEFMEGIPGNVGGALRMNAGAMQSWMFEVVESVRTMDVNGEVREWRRDELDAGYRHVPQLESCTVLSAVLQAVPRDAADVQAILDSYSNRRWATQPPKPSAGCSFKNPSNIPAGKLIEELGLKGQRRGGAEISPVHGNFIVNNGGATANDVLGLIELIQNKARVERGIKLETEVIILGEDLE